MPETARRLTVRQEAFARLYVVLWNASEAARQAGYSPKIAGEIGSENLKKPHVARRITELAQGSQMSPEEIIARLTAQARGAHAEYIKTNALGHPYLDLKGLKAAGLGHLIKSVSVTVKGIVTWTFYDAQQALALLGRASGALVDQQAVAIAVASARAVRDAILEAGEIVDSDTLAAEEPASSAPVLLLGSGEELAAPTDGEDSV